jgi:hypothetical protein
MQEEKPPEPVIEWRKKMRKLTYALVPVCIIAGIVFLALTLYFHPWTPDLGAPSSPQRMFYKNIFEGLLLKGPLAILAATIVARHTHWLAPPGKRDPTQVYPLFSPYRVIAIVFCSALFASLGVLSYTFFDACAAGAAFACMFFDPITGFFTLWFGDTLRALIWGTGSPIEWLLLGRGVSDGSTWIWLGLFYWLFKESRWVKKLGAGKRLTVLIVFWVIVYWVWRFIYMFPIWLWIDPPPALWTRQIWMVTSFLPSGTTASIVALIISETLERQLGARKRF